MTMTLFHGCNPKGCYVIDVSTTISRIEQQIADRKGDRKTFLMTARIAPSTWWRWKQGMTPKVSTWRRALIAAAELE